MRSEHYWHKVGEGVIHSRSFEKGSLASQRFHIYLHGGAVKEVLHFPSCMKTHENTAPKAL